MTIRHRSIEQLIEEQGRRWSLQPSPARDREWRPVVAISRLHGAGGEEVARRLCETLHLDMFDREIIQCIAEDTHLGARVVEALDERDRSQIDEWLAPFADSHYLTHYDYLHHLIEVVTAIARKGAAVIVGRGAHLLLPPGEALRVLVVAPLETRVAVVAAEEHLSARDARGRIAAVEAERSAFLRKNFHVEFNEASHFDLVVNTACLGIEGTVATIRAAAAALPGPAHVRSGAEAAARLRP
jgi:cytidylate kinase